MVATSSETQGKNLIVKLVEWIIEGLERTIFMGMKLQLPSKVVNPLGFLGVLTFIVFVILGITGGFLMVFYEPTFAGAFESVERINNEIPYGFPLRNIHYHASNAMVFLALCHMYYQYFSGRFKLRNQILWVTGVLLGTITVLEAFSGYDLIVNERAVLALSIGASLNNAAPVIGPLIVKTLFGSGFQDYIIRFYALHVFIVPVVMIILMFVHFPRALVFDVPMSAAVVGSILIVGGLFPVELGLKFDPNLPPGITVPEWYLTGLYAFLRTGVDRFISGVLLPTIFILMFMVIPFVDTGKKFSWKDRPFFTALAIASIGQIIVTTVWGFYVVPVEIEKDLTKRLFVEPTPFYTILLGTVAISFAATYAFLRWLKKGETHGHGRRVSGRPTPIVLSGRWIFAVLLGIILFQIFINYLAVNAYALGFKNLALFEAGIALLTFALIVHLYRFGHKLI